MNKKSLLTTMSVVAGGAAAYSGIVSLVNYEIFNRNSKLPSKINDIMKGRTKKNLKPQKPKDPRAEWTKSQQFQIFNIVNPRGEKLQAFYLPAETESDKFVLCSHGYRNQGRSEFRFISKFYHDNGFNLFIVDHTASGDSEGTHITFGYNESKDLLQWIDFMKSEFGENIQIILHGISMGSATVMLLSDKNLPDDVKFIVADCGYTSVRDQFMKVIREYHLPANLLYNSIKILNKIQNGYCIDDVQPIESVKKAKLPMLFVHGEHDGFVPPWMGEKLFEVCPTDKDLLIAEKAGHAASYQKSSEKYEKKILEFADKYMN